MRLPWLNNSFICKDLYAPFVVDKDDYYIKDLKDKYALIKRQAESAGADENSLLIIDKYSSAIIEALEQYYRADISECNITIENLLKDIGEDPFAVSLLKDSYAFPGNHQQEIQFFRSRNGNPSNAYSAKEMMYLPKEDRARTGNYRFSIPGNPSLYLANSSYGCWIETGFPADNDFNVSPVLLDGEQKIFNLAVSIRDFTCLHEFESGRVHTWLKLVMLNIATSYRVKETGRVCKSEYVISQSIMMACKKLGYDGIAYYSKRVSYEGFALCAINLALFVDYENESKNIMNHIEIDDSFNYAVYKNLLPSLRDKEYPLRVVGIGRSVRIGAYYRQFPYIETEFICFDKFLFKTWEEK